MDISHKAASKLANNITTTNRAIDDAVLHVATLTASIVETCRNSEIPPSRSQPAICEMTKGLSQLVDAREGFIKAHRNIVKVQKDSNLQVVDFGCLPDIPKFAGSNGLRVVGE